LREPIGAHHHERLTLRVGQQGNGGNKLLQRKLVLLSGFLVLRPGARAIDVLDFPTKFPQLRKERVPQDREQPCTEIGLRLVLVAICPGLLKRVLDQILGPMLA
jgi:hypothetical protein